jgi:hypothetical protein
MLIGYMRVSKADGSQILDLQREELLQAGILPEHLWGTSERIYCWNVSTFKWHGAVWSWHLVRHVVVEVDGFCGQ